LDLASTSRWLMGGVVMQSKPLIKGLVVLGVLVAIWWWTQPEAPRTSDEAASAGLVDFDINAVAEVVIEQPDETLRTRRVDGVWVVPDAFDYPADAERLVEALRGVATARAGEVVRGGEALLDEFGLNPDGGGEARPRSVLRFLDEGGAELGRIALGQDRAPRARDGAPAFPDSQYVRVDDGPVQIWTDRTFRFPSTRSLLLDSTLLQVQGTTLTSVVTQVQGEPALRVHRQADGRLAMAGLPAHEQVNAGTARSLFNALQFLSFVDIAGPRHAELDIDFSQPDRFEAWAGDGLRYVIEAVAPEGDAGPRYFTLAVLADEQEDEAATPHAMQSTFEGWVYQMPANSYRAMFPTRGQLIEPAPAGGDQADSDA
jgi:hypothetical protein